MSALSPIKNLKTMKADMANMTYQEKLIHIWTYYKWVLVVVLILIMVASILLASITNLRKITLLGGVTVNVQVSEEGHTYLTENYKQLIGTGSKREAVYQSYMDIASVEDVMSDNYYAVLSLLALCENEELDYLIVDQVGFETMLIQGAYMNLDQVYTAQELEAFGDKVIFAQQKGQDKPTALALDITDCPFIQEHTQESGPVYFVYVANAPRVNQCKDFYNYLMDYKPE